MTSYDKYLYVMQAENGLCKIGVAGDVASRLRVIRSFSPLRIKVLFYIDTSSYSTELEKRLHTKFSEKNHHGEWFKLSNKDIEFIKSCGEVKLFSEENTGLTLKITKTGASLYFRTCPNCSRRNKPKRIKNILYVTCRRCRYKEEINLDEGDAMIEALAQGKLEISRKDTK